MVVFMLVITCLFGGIFTNPFHSPLTLFIWVFWIFTFIYNIGAFVEEKKMNKDSEYRKGVKKQVQDKENLDTAIRLRDAGVSKDMWEKYLSQKEGEEK